jgi:hypothetical protein
VQAPATVRVEWMTSTGSNSGVFVGFPTVGNDPLVAVEQGYEVQIDASDEAGWTTGAIYGFQAADTGAVEQALNEGWNFEIALDPPESSSPEQAGRQPLPHRLGAGRSRGQVCRAPDHGPGDVVVFGASR